MLLLTESCNKIEELKGFDVKKGEQCVNCPVAKFTKQPFKLSESRAKMPFELVHIDTWGPYRVSTREGYRYFLTVVDDFSRVTWVHILKAKNEAYSAILQFVNMAST